MDIDDGPKPALRFTTAREMLAGGYKLAGYCRKCKRWGDVDLARLVRDGKGDESLIGRPMRCRRCGSEGEAQLQPPTPGSPGYDPRNRPGGGS